MRILKQTGSRGIVKKGQGVQVIYGPHVTVIKANLEDYLETAEDMPLGETTAFAEEAASEPEEVQTTSSKEQDSEKKVKETVIISSRLREMQWSFQRFRMRDLPENDGRRSRQ